MKTSPVKKTLMILQVASLLTLITSLIIHLTQAPALANDIVVDPNKAYSPDAVKAASNTSHLGEWLTGSGWTWVALIALVTLLLATLVIGKLYTLLILGGIASLAGLLIAFTLAHDTFNDTFSTWAEQRYGIEIQEYPTYSKSINTKTAVRLDSGQMVRMQVILDARGDLAYLIAPAKGSDEELEVIL